MVKVVQRSKAAEGDFLAAVTYKLFYAMLL